MLARRVMRRGRDSGAAAVEFALVVPVLLLLVFGIIDYGLFFSDSLAARDGVRMSARQGIVENFAAGSCSGYVPTGSDSQLDKLACLAVEQTGSIGGDAYARVSNLQEWKAGSDLSVCVAVVEDGLTGITPMPNNHTVRAKVLMRIEQASLSASGPKPANSTGEARRSSSPSLPSGLWTSWCP